MGFNSGFKGLSQTLTKMTNTCGCRLESCMTPATSNMLNNTRSCKYSCDAPDDERKYHLEHVELSRNNKLSYTVASCWSFS